MAVKNTHEIELDPEISRTYHAILGGGRSREFEGVKFGEKGAWTADNRSAIEALDLANRTLEKWEFVNPGYDKVRQVTFGEGDTPEEERASIQALGVLFAHRFVRENKYLNFDVKKRHMGKLNGNNNVNTLYVKLSCVEPYKYDKTLVINSGLSEEELKIAAADIRYNTHLIHKLKEGEEFKGRDIFEEIATFNKECAYRGDKWEPWHI